MDAGIHNFELHAFRAAFQMVLYFNLDLLHAFCNLLYVNPHHLHFNIKKLKKKCRWPLT